MRDENFSIRFRHHDGKNGTAQRLLSIVEQGCLFDRSKLPNAHPGVAFQTCATLPLRLKTLHTKILGTKNVP